LDNKQEVLNDKAENQWKKHQDDPSYTEAEHCEWLADHDDGVSYYIRHCF